MFGKRPKILITALGPAFGASLDNPFVWVTNNADFKDFLNGLTLQAVFAERQITFRTVFDINRGLG